MALSDIQVDDAARVLWDARRAGEVIDGLPADCRPDSLADAYRVQDRLFQVMGRAQAGWFVGCSNPEIQRQLGLPEPYRAPLLTDTVFDSPASLPARDYPGLTLELEFAFRLDRDLPPRVGGYGPAEVAGAVAAVHPAIEVVSSHLADWTRQPIFDIIADNGTDGALVVGLGREDWRALGLASVEVELAVNGASRRSGTGADVMGNPMAVFVWLVNALCEAGVTMRAGDLHNTGSCTAMYFPEPGDRAVARFVGLGEVVADFPA